MNVLELPTRNLRLVDPKALGGTGRPWLLVHGIRTAFLILILLVSLVYQIQIGSFLNVEIWLPVYSVLLVNFFLNSIFLFFIDRLDSTPYWNGILFGLDAVAVTLLIYFTGTGQSLFLFLYLVNLILGSLVFQKDTAWLLAIWTSICFSSLLIVSPEISGSSLYFSLAVNNVAFVAVTYLSGRLAEQLSQVGARLKETQTDLLVLHNLNELIINNITSGLVVISRTGFIQYMNPRAGQILGSEQLLQIKMSEVLPELNWPWETLVEHENTPFERREVRVQRASGEVQILEVVAARFKDPEARLKGWLFLLDDRTDQKRLEETFRQQEKLAAVGQLAAGIAHEVRNPLASISGSIQLMLANPTEHTEENIRLMRIVDKEINRLNGLITEFLEYVRPERKARDPVDLNSVIREVLEAVRFNPKLRQGVEQRVHLKAQCAILGDRDKLKQALLNFLINAYQAVEKVDSPTVEVETHDQREWVVMVIRDNGCGIKKENLNRIFEPFHTTKPQGTGLGLAVTHKILQAHETRILVDSEEGVGTRITVEFPAHRDVHTEDLIPFRQEAKG
ncbi:MAG: nitrogen regulation protein NR(II) [Bdellovibrionales bacterium]